MSLFWRLCKGTTAFSAGMFVGVVYGSIVATLTALVTVAALGGL